MRRYLPQILLWAPRILGILFALFVSLFALDIFGAGYGFWETIVGLLMHLLPVFILLLGIAIAWRWKWVGALVFLGFCVWYLITFDSQFHWSVYLIMAGPSFIIGMLFLFDWLYLPKLLPQH